MLDGNEVSTTIYNDKYGIAKLNVRRAAPPLVFRGKPEQGCRDILTHVYLSQYKRACMEYAEIDGSFSAGATLYGVCAIHY